MPRSDFDEPPLEQTPALGATPATFTDALPDDGLTPEELAQTSFEPPAQVSSAMSEAPPLEPRPEPVRRIWQANE